MKNPRGGRRTVTLKRACGTVVGLAVFASAVSCRQSVRARAASSNVVLRVGVGQLSATNAGFGLRQLVRNLSVESLLRPGEDGRMQPFLAERWTVGYDGRSVMLKLRPSVKFHDGTALDPVAVAKILPQTLSNFMGPVFNAFDYAKALDG